MLVSRPAPCPENVSLVSLWSTTCYHRRACVGRLLVRTWWPEGSSRGLAAAIPSFNLATHIQDAPNCPLTDCWDSRSSSYACHTRLGGANGRFWNRLQSQPFTAQPVAAQSGWRLWRCTGCHCGRQTNSHGFTGNTSGQQWLSANADRTKQ